MDKNNKQLQVVPIGQYVKNISFENYKNRSELAELKTKPETEFKLATLKENLTDDIYRVALQIEVKARISDDNFMFKVNLEYAGEFKIIGDTSEEIKEEILLVNCLTLLFPFARQVIAEASINGGYPAMLLDPIDFRNTYLAYKNKVQKQSLAKAAN